MVGSSGSASASDSANLVYWIVSDRVGNGIRRNGNVLILPTLINSVELMTSLTTPIFNFHQVISSLMTPTPTPTPSPTLWLVETSLNKSPGSAQIYN